MTEYEKMIKGLLYDPGDEEIAKKQIPYLDKLWEFNQLKPSQTKEKETYMKEVFAECGDNNYIELPFHANFGGHHVHLGSYVYANFNLTLIDDGHIYIGDRVMIGPNVTIATAGHPVDPDLRRKNLQYNKDVHIGENVWIGAGVIIMPGITIGKNTVIGAGSIVTRDIPENCIAVGNPCRVMREVSERDKEYFYKNEKVADCF
ncbi:MAG: sugar O-acetyltransferase [Erysipelotrichaceae bacterium]|nr:sugar O-acetyltransferase [Erysipelotrichaceae bacterium]